MAENKQPYEADVALLLAQNYKEAEMESTFRSGLLGETARVVSARARSGLRRMTFAAVAGAAMLIIALLAWHSLTATQVKPPSPQPSNTTPAAIVQKGNSNESKSAPQQVNVPPKNQAKNSLEIAAMPGRSATKRPAIAKNAEPLLVVIAARQPATDNTGHKLVIGDKVFSGATVGTGKKGRLRLITRHGSEFAVAPESVLNISKDGKRAKLIKGRIYCRNRIHEFSEIITTAGKIELLGTTIDAAMKTPKTVAVTVVQGSVRLKNAYGQMLVASGKQAILSEAAAPEVGSEVNITAELAWYDGRGSIMSDYGDIAYTVKRDGEPFVEVWAMDLQGEGKRHLQSYLGFAFLTGSWLAGRQDLLMQPISLCWRYPKAGERLAHEYNGNFILGRKGGNYPREWLLNAATGQDMLIELPEDYTPIRPFSLAPDGSLFATTGVTNQDEGVYLYELSSGCFRNLSTLHSTGEGVSWSPDGKMIAGTAFFSPERYEQLITIDIDTGHTIDYQIQAQNPVFSPDGAYLAFTSDFGAVFGAHGSVFVLSLQPGSKPQRITPKGEGAWYPQWSPDGSRLLYWVMPTDSEMPPTSIHVVNSDGSSNHIVYSGDTHKTAWSPEGKSIFISTVLGILKVSADQSHELENLGGKAEDSLLSPLISDEMKRASQAVQEAVFQFSLGKWRAYEGRFEESRTAFMKSSDIFVSLPYNYPHMQFSLSNVLLYVDTAFALANRPTAVVSEEICGIHLTHLSALIDRYRRQHNEPYPASLWELISWAKTINNLRMDDWLNPSAVDLNPMLRCPEGNPYEYRPPVGGKPVEGEVALRCPRHAKNILRWESGRPGTLSQYSEMGWGK